MENEFIEKGKKKSGKPAAKKTRSAQKKSGPEKAKGKPTLELLRDRFNKKKVKSITGVSITLISVFLFLAVFSYLLTWKEDQNRVMGIGLFEFIFDGSEEPVANWLGKFGAWFSHLLVYRWFGFASIAIPVLLFGIGIKLLLNFSLFPIRKALTIVALFTVWTSIFLGYFSSTINYLGGTMGYQVNEWLFLTLGKFGTLIAILVLGYVFGLIAFDLNLKALWDRLQGIKRSNDANDTDELPEVLDANDMSVANKLSKDRMEKDPDPETILFDEDEEYEEDDAIDYVVTKKDPVQEASIMDFDKTSEIIDETFNSDDDSFSVEVSKEDEVLSEDEVDKKVAEFGEYDPKLDLASYALPSIDLLTDYGVSKTINVDKAELEQNKNKIVETLQNYKIEISKIMATIGPTVTLYEIVPAPGVRISKIKNLEDDIALSLSALGIRIIAPIPGKGTIGIEVPNSKPEMVSMRSLIASKKFQESDFELPVVMGKTITNETYTFDLTKMPHLLVAGATGQGKSVGLNAILVSILYKKHPAQIKFVLVDPKKVELTLYNKIERHFLAKLPGEEEAIITDTSKVVNTLNSLCIEMDDRYELLKLAQCRTIKEYNTKFVARKLNPENGHHYLPYIVVLIDEFADLIMTAGKEVEHPIARIAQLARAIGIHLIVATQRPSVNVITGMIKANFPARIAFRVLSKIDSRTILDGSGADQLIGRGDMLISTGSDIVRLQCGFVDTPEVEAICDFIGDQRGYPDALLLPEYVGENSESGGSMDDEELDPLFAEAARIVTVHQQGSASLLQRKLKLGYNRAGRIVDQLEAYNIIGPFRGSKAREVLFSDEMSVNEFLSSKGIE